MRRKSRLDPTDSAGPLRWFNFRNRRSMNLKGTLRQPPIDGGRRPAMMARGCQWPSTVATGSMRIQVVAWRGCHRDCGTGTQYWHGRARPQKPIPLQLWMTMLKHIPS